MKTGGIAVATDAAGNVYTTGYFFGTADFDPGPSTFNLTSAGDKDIFVSKLDSAGNFVWARNMGGTGNDQGRGIAVDAAGNVYTTGSFASGAADFDPGAGTFNLTSAGGNDIFVSKLDTAGNFVWARSMGGSVGGFFTDLGYGIAVDSSGHVYTTGLFSGTVDFDPGAGTANLTSTSLAADVFVSKLDSAGNFVWARNMGGSARDEGHGIAVDSSGNVYTTGFYVGTADFDPGAGTFNLTSAGVFDIFVSKLDSAGNFVWARSLGGSGVSEFGQGIAVDGGGNVYTTGLFEGTADFDPGAGTFNLTSVGTSDIFVSKLDSAGNFIWARSMGGSNVDEGRGIDVDTAGNVYTTGQFQDTADFDPGGGTFNLISAGGSKIYVSKLDSAGDFVWARGLGNGLGNGIAVDAAGGVYTTGYFQGAADFDPGAGTANLTSAGSTDIFVSQLTQPAPGAEVEFTAANFSDVEGVGTSTVVTLERSDDSAVSQVQVSVTGGTAMGGNVDYDESSFPLTVTFNVGELTKNVPIPIVQESLVELDETITLEIIAISGATIGSQDTTTLTVENDDIATVSIADDVVLEGDPGDTVQLVFDVTLDNPVDVDVTFDYQTQDGTAVDGQDYDATSGTLTISAGATTGQITVDVTEELLVELDETLTLASQNLQAGGRDVTLVGTDAILGGWSQLGADIDGLQAQENVGAAVAMSADGNTIIVRWNGQ